MFKQRGLSLLELLIAIALGVILIGGVMQMFLSSRQVFSTQQAMSRVQESGRLAIEFISEDIRMAGFMGCLTRESEIENDLEDSFWTDFTNTSRLAQGIAGYAAGAAGLPEGLSPAPTANTDILVVRYAGGVASVVVNAPVPEGGGVAEVKSGELHIAGNGSQLNTGSLLVSNCVAARIFSATGIDAGDTSSTIKHGGNWPSTIVGRFSDFYPGAEVLSVNTIVYYIGENPAGRPSLYRSEGGQTPQELIDGIENMVLRFGAEGTYKAAADLKSEADWEVVDSVRVEFVVQGNEINVLESPQAYTLTGVSVDGPADRRLRQVFASTVAIRSRVK